MQTSVTSWTEYKDDTGRSYYHNRMTNETTWVQPEEFRRELSKRKLGIAYFSADAPPVLPLQPSMPSYYTRHGSAQMPKQTIAMSRPVSSTPVQGTPWLVVLLATFDSSLSLCRCVVWTGDYRVFFYNPSTRTSVWERPTALYGRNDVDALLAHPPAVTQVRFA